MEGVQSGDEKGVSNCQFISYCCEREIGWGLAPENKAKYKFKILRKCLFSFLWKTFYKTKAQQLLKTKCMIKSVKFIPY